MNLPLRLKLYVFGKWSSLGGRTNTSCHNEASVYQISDALIHIYCSWALSLANTHFYDPTSFIHTVCNEIYHLLVT